MTDKELAEYLARDLETIAERLRSEPAVVEDIDDNQRATITGVEQRLTVEILWPDRVAPPSSETNTGGSGD